MITNLPILFDVDGVLNDFTQFLLDSISNDTNIDVPTVNEIKSYTLKNYISNEAWEYAKELMKTSIFWESIQPINQDVIELIRQHNKEIVFVTSPWISCKEWESTRRKWLKKYFKATNSQIIFINRKELTRGEILIEDKADTLNKWCRYNKNKKAILVNRPWNETSTLTSHNINRIHETDLYNWFKNYLRE